MPCSGELEEKTGFAPHPLTALLLLRSICLPSIRLYSLGFALPLCAYRRYLLTLILTQATMILF